MISQFQGPRGLRPGLTAARFLGCGFESHREHGCISCECFVFCLVRGLCVGPITRTDEPSRMWCVWGWWWNPHSEEV